MTQTTAAIYARISTDKRKGTKEEGASVAAQVKACREFATQQKWAISKVYEDNDISATSGAVRPGFEQLLADAPEIVVVWRQERLERGTDDSLQRFLVKGCTGYTVDGAVISVETAGQEFMTNLRSLLGKLEGRQKSERQKLRNLSDAEAGRWHYSRPVFGNDKKTGKLIASEAQAIREAADALSSGETTFYQVAKTWNAAGLHTPRSKGAGGRPWEPGTVRNFFTKPRLIGQRVYEGTTYHMDGWEPVLDPETFDAIQQHIEANKTGKRGVQGSRHTPHLLTGIATCGVCGKGLNVNYRGGKDSARNYRCTVPGHVSRVAIPLETFVVEKFLYLLAHQGAEAVVHPDSAGTLHELRLQRMMLLSDHDKWLNDAAEHGLSPAIISRKEAAHTKQLADLNAQTVALTQATSFTDLVPEIFEGSDALWKRWEAIPVVKQRAVISALFDGIIVHPCPQGVRFKPQYVQLRAGELMMKLVDLNAEVTVISPEMAAILLRKS